MNRNEVYISNEGYLCTSLSGTPLYHILGVLPVLGDSPGFQPATENKLNQPAWVVSESQLTYFLVHRGSDLSPSVMVDLMKVSIPSPFATHLYRALELFYLNTHFLVFSLVEI